MLDDLVLGTLARLEAEDAAERDAGLPAAQRSRAVAPTTGRFLFALASSQAGIEVLEIGGSRGYSSIWLASGARVLGGRLVSLESDPAKCAAWRSNIASAGLDEWAELVEGDAHETLARTEDVFDLVFLDAEKDGYEALSRSRDLFSSPAVSSSPTTCSRTSTRSARIRLRDRWTGRSRASPFPSTVASKCRWCSAPLPDLAHQTVQVAVGVAEERHPQLVVRHLGDEVRLVLERDTAVGERLARRVDVVDPEGDRRARVVELLAVGLREHESHVAAHQERERSCVEEEVEAERVAVEGHGAWDVVNPDGDLADVRDGGTLGALARAEQVSAPTMSRLVSALERDGLVVREPHAEDGRAVVVAASAKGREILERGRERRISELAALLDGLESNELETLAEAARIIERVSSLPPSARSAYAGRTAERRWSGLSDDSTGSGGTSG